MTTHHAAFLTLALLATAAPAQALLRGPREGQVDRSGDPDPSAALRATSLIVVQAPKPKTFEIHDLVTIIISESSKQSSQQKLDTKQNTGIQANLNNFIDLGDLAEGNLNTTSNGTIAQVDMTSNEKWKGDAKYERNDRFTDKISAEVIDVKPNGVLVIEARRTVTKDDEVQTMVLAGSCRRDDITNANTILSSQLADMTLTVKNDGELRDTNKPGWITRLFRAVFDF